MAECLKVSLKTIDTWIRKGAPVFDRGTNGKAYLLDSVAFVEWTRAYRSGISIEELRRADEADPCMHLLQQMFLLEVENAQLRRELAAAKRRDKRSAKLRPAV